MEKQNEEVVPLKPVNPALWSMFQSAVMQKDLETVKRLVTEGLDVNLSIGLKGTPLCSAIEAGTTDIVRHLISANCNVNKNNDDGESPLSLAIRKKNLDIVTMLIEAGSEVKNDQCKVGDLPLCDAVRYNWPSIVEKLLQYGARVNALNHDYDTALNLSVSLGHRKITEILLQNGADPLMYNNNGNASVHISAMMGDLSSLQTIVSFANSQNSPTHATPSGASNSEQPGILRYLDYRQRLTGRTLLHIAVANSCVEVAKFLIESGCDLNARTNNGETPLSMACCDRNAYLVKLLIEARCDVNAPAYDLTLLRFRTLSSKTYPLHIAVSKSSLPIFKLLVEAGADVNRVNQNEASPLSVALELKCTNIVNYLLEYGPERGLNLRKIIYENHGRNPLLDVVNCGDQEASNFALKLIMLGCPLDGSGVSNHMSPLHAAAEQECLGLIRTLLAHGADMREYDSDGHMPLHMCVLYGISGAFQVLLEHGANVNWKTKHNSHSNLVFAIENHNSGYNTQILGKLLKAGHRLPSSKFLENCDTESSVCNAEDFEIFSELEEIDPELFAQMKTLCKMPKTLAELSCHAVRDYFVSHRILLSKVEEVDLPIALKAMVQMRDD